MSMYKSPKTDEELIGRTQKILEQYEALELQLCEEYFDVTLYFNCLLSLIVLPRGAKLNQLEELQVPESIKKTIKEVIDKDKGRKDINFKQYITGLRNGVAHFGENNSLKFKNDGETITAVEITGSINKRTIQITYEFDLKNGNQLKKTVEEILKFTGYKT